MTAVTLLKIKDVERITALKKSAIYQGIHEGTFPEPVRLSKRSVAWRSDELETWIESRPRVTAARSAKEAAE
ncbi:hypothetical protein GF1_11750 [Desulfolithobacter dissulfuricans]|uniref:Phage transcriptional regulator, AlpA n=1 Tax=Desulfolithobacter dissulfuricans TaxID=2795293 RepID=A0A915U0N6_9BACT|nr:AlpA family phage regulatory protein [Desulfolithobacter dissulfuricans]BCO08799.1 hypothetical protein GF1_11750 [Desulfolithobacter dissulfuricans]